jgi:sugar/nucleoside kinase (ribokinase family)
MKYLVVSTAVLDIIVLPNGITQNPVLGGAGIYALSGIKVWHDDVKIITGIGEDFLASPGEWFARNNLTTSGLIIKDKHTPRTTIHYFDDGERVEAPVYGADHYHRLMASAADVSDHCAADTVGVYVFRDTAPEFWQALIGLKAKYHFKLMWELNASVAAPERLPEVIAVLNHCDIFSLNKQEALTLFSVNRIEDAITNLQSLRRPLVYFRIGEAGAYIITPENHHHIPPVPNVHVVDPTGAGNSSSGAVLVGYCQGQGPVTIGTMGAISAAYCLAQYGPPRLLDNSVRRQAHETLARQISKL